jgi:psiF repeat
MRHSISIVALGLALVSGVAFAADPVKPAAAPAAASPAAEKTPQQNKMATCNKEAEGKKGDERKAFMKDCLSANKQEKQQNKMKTCNAEAAGKKGDERKAFMSECLKK